MWCAPLMRGRRVTGPAAGWPRVRGWLQLKDAAKVASYTPGQQLQVSEIFKEGEVVDVAGTTIGKGFQGEREALARGCGETWPVSSDQVLSSSRVGVILARVCAGQRTWLGSSGLIAGPCVPPRRLCAGTIKRWNHKRGFMTHGSKSHREHGSIGSSTTPSRVFPGLKMAGHMGNVRCTVRKQPVSAGGELLVLQMRAAWSRASQQPDGARWRTGVKVAHGQPALHARPSS